MLPGIDAQQGDQGAADGVLVGPGDETEGAALLILHQPRPAAALDAGKSSVCLLAEGLERAEVGVNRFLSTASRVSKRIGWGLAT